MSTKFSVKDTILDQVQTMVDVNTSQRSKSDILLFAGVPALVAALGALLNVHLRGTGEMIGGIAVLTGLLFGLVTWVFQLRMSAAHDPRTAGVANLLCLLDELFANVLYAVLVGMASTLVVVAAASLGENPLNRWWSAGVLLALTHFAMVVLMCLKRVRAAYRQLTAR